MRTKEEIELRMGQMRNRFAAVYASDSEASIYLYQRYRELWWVLHPEVDDWNEIARQVNAELGIKGR